MSSAAIERLPDPDLFRDAVWLANYGRWSPSDLDEMDALLHALVHKLRNVKVTRGPT